MMYEISMRTLGKVQNLSPNIHHRQNAIEEQLYDDSLPVVMVVLVSAGVGYTDVIRSRKYCSSTSWCWC
jgi:hypothetical protein